MKIIIDAFGGDKAPSEIIKGSALAVKELGVDILLVGDEQRIKTCVKDHQIDMEHMDILNAPDLIGMEDNPSSIMKEKTDSSMAVALKALADGKGDGLVSAGNTGALTMGATFIVKRIKGIKRPAIASILPTTKEPVLLMDCGANVECRPEVLFQFGTMGDVYMKNVMGTNSPRVCLANNGVEEIKGPQHVRDAYQLMKNAHFNFRGNVEARSIPFGACDVVVADGFTGNMILKMYEGVASALMGSIKEIFMKNLKTKLAALMVKNDIDGFKKRMDYKEYGGAVLLGIKKVVVKAHGSSDASAFKNAIRQAVKFHQTGVIQEIQALSTAAAD